MTNKIMKIEEGVIKNNPSRINKSYTNMTHKQKYNWLIMLLSVLALILCLVMLCFCSDNIKGEIVGMIYTIISIFGCLIKDSLDKKDNK